MVHDYTVIDSFNASKGKFGNALGNVALIDCNYAKRLLQSFYFQGFENLIEDQPLLYVIINDIHNSIVD